MGFSNKQSPVNNFALEMNLQAVPPVIIWINHVDSGKWGKYSPMMRRALQIKMKSIILTLARYIVCLVTVIFTGCGTTRTYDIPFEEAEATLFTRLNLDPVQTTTKPDWVQAKAQNELGRVMTKKLYAVVLHEYDPGTALSFTCHHLYDIGAVGGEYIRFDLRTKSPQKTRITVDYCDRWYGMWPPFIFWNPGLIRESKIHKLIWKKDYVNNVPEAMAPSLAAP